MAQWENADGWEDAGWEDAPSGDFLDQLKTAAKSSFSEVGNTVDRAFTGMALGAQHLFQGPNEEGDKMYQELQDRIKSREAFAQEGATKPGIAASTGGMAATLPMQMLTFPLSPFTTGQKSLENGEDLKTAQQNAGIDTAGNALAVALPASVGARKLVQAGTGAAMNAAQTYATGKAIAANSSTKENKLAFEPTWEQIAQAALLGGAIGPTVGSKPKAEAPNKVLAALDALDATKKTEVPPEAPPKPPIDTTHQMELPDSAMIQAPQYGVHDGMGRVDENGMPIRADISMEAQNLQNPLQMNLWGDELGPAQGAERGLTDALDQMPKGIQRNIAMKRMGKNAPDLASPEMNAAKFEADNALAPREGPFSLPEKQRGAINMDVFDPAFKVIKELANGIKLVMNGTRQGPVVRAVDSNGKIVGETQFSHDTWARPPRETDNLEAGWVTTDPKKTSAAGMDADRLAPTTKSQYPGLATEMYKFAAEQGNDIVRSGAQTPEGKAMWDRFENKGISQGGKIPRSQRGGIDFKAVTDTVNSVVEKVGEKFKPPVTKEDAIGKLPGMKGAGKDLVYVPEAGPLLAEKARTEADGPKLFQNFQSGLDNASEKSGSTLMKGTAQWLQYARRMAEYQIRNVVIPLEQTLSRLKTDDMISLMDVNRREMFNRKQYTPEELASVGLSDKQIKAYAQFREAQAKVLEVQNAGRAAQGKEPITPQAAYLASVFRGDYHVAVKDAEGNLKWYIQQPTEKAAKAAIKWLQENGKDVDLSNLKVEYKPRPFANVPQDVMGAYQDAMKMFPADDPVAQRVRSIMEEYAQQRGNSFLSQNLHHVDKKENIRGFEGDQPWLSKKENAYNQAHAQMDYMKNAYRWAHMQEALNQITPLVSDPELVKSQPNNMETTKAYVMNNMGVSKNMFKGFENYMAKALGRSSSMVPGIVRDFKGLAYMAQLGASVGYMIATPLQLIPGLAAWHTALGFEAKNFYKDLPLTISDGLIGIYHDLGKDASGGKWDSTAVMSPFGKEAYRWAEANGVFSTNLFDENAGLGSHKILAEGKNKLGYTISKPDQVSRWMSFLSFARHLDDGKTPREQVFQRASELTEHVATDMHRQARPLVVDQFGAAGEAAYMYKAPQVNMLNTLSIMARKAAAGSPGPFLAYLSAMAIMGGVLNLPGVQELDSAWNLFKKGLAEAKPHWYKHVEGVGIKEFMLSHFSDNTVAGQTINWGAASVMTGANMASRFSQGVLDLENPLGGISPLGQELYEQAAIGKAAINPNRDTIAQAMHVNSPPLLKGALESFHPSFKSGVSAPDGSWTGYRNPNKVTDTATFVKRSPQEEKYKQVGLTALTEAQRRTKDYVNNAESSRVKTAQQNMLDNLFGAIKRDDPEDIQKYAKGYFQLHGDSDKFLSDIMMKINRLGMTPAEFQKTHIKGLSTLNNVMRRMEMDKGNQ